MNKSAKKAAKKPTKQATTSSTRRVTKKAPTKKATTKTTAKPNVVVKAKTAKQLKAEGEALSTAIANNRLNELRALLAGGADINAPGPYGSLLAHAAMFSNLKVFELVLQSGAALDGKGTALGASQPMTALMNACNRSGALATNMARLLLDAGADVRYAGAANDYDALCCASEEGEGALIELLLERGAPADGPPNVVLTPLMHAARGNNVDAIRVLLARGADPKKKCVGLAWADGMTAYDLAVHDKNKEAAALLADA